jgi:hypothetical protein
MSRKIISMNLYNSVSKSNVGEAAGGGAKSTYD